MRHMAHALSRQTRVEVSWNKYIVEKLLGRGQHKGKGSPLARRAFDPQGAVVALDEFLAEHQPQTGAGLACRALGRIEIAHQYLFQRLGGDARPGILYKNGYAFG